MQFVKVLCLLCALLLLTTTSRCVSAQGAGSPSVGMPIQHEKSADMDTIHQMFADTSKIKRAVKQIPNGVEATTESDDSKVVTLIQQHTKAMQRRLKDRRPIRAWDPLFAALFQHAATIQLRVTNTSKGVKITETSDDPNTVKIIHAHATAVSGFVHDGMAGMAKRHEDPLKKTAVAAHQANFLGKGDGITTCPVTGEPVDRSIHTAINGRTIYFCCASCVAVVKKNPESYLKPTAP